ncbi:MAG: c-type cytochrome domain-containing protein [Flavobacteriaceae bacterium]
MNSFLAFDLTHFIGRFHPLFVHLPIGFLLMAILMEWYQRIRKKEKLSGLVRFAWLLSGIGGALAAFCGWWLGETGLYVEGDLFWHRWIGIALVALSFLGWWLKKRPENHKRIVHGALNVLMLALIAFEGHLGGNLTHGEAYLFEYAPEPLRNLMLVDKTATVDLSKSDSVLVYNDLIKPIFEQKCFACHDNNIQRGGLNMARIETLLIGGDEGPAVIPSNVVESELFRRVTLPQKNQKFMPPVGDPLTYDEIKIVEWWIAQGAAFDIKITDVEVTEEIKPTLLRHYGLDTNPKPYYEMVSITPLDSIEITNLEKLGFTVRTLGATNPLLDVKFSGEDLTPEKLKGLEPAANHITWLSLAQTNITDEGLAIIGKFKNLTRLQLEKTEITDAGISNLTTLEHLEALNLYRTNVTNACLSSIQQMRSLKRLYLWQTKVTATDAKVLEESNKDLNVVVGQS